MSETCSSVVLADFVRRMRFFMIISGNAIQNAAWDSRVFPLA